MASLKLQAGTALEITPSDTENIPYLDSDSPNEGCVLYIGGTGDLKVTTISNNIVTFKAVPVMFFPVNVIKVWSTGTTATDIVALW